MWNDNAVKIVTTHKFAHFTATEKVFSWRGTLWRYTVSGKGRKFLLAILGNTTGHLLALPLAEEFRDTYTTIALSPPPIKSFAETTEGLKAVLDAEGITVCDAIGQSNGGVHLQSLINRYLGVIEKVVFSHSMTSMDKNDAYTTNASEVKVYKIMRRMLKILPVSVLSFAMGHMVLPKISLKSGAADTKRLVALCKEDMRRLTKQDFLTLAERMEDFLFHYTFAPKPYRANPQNVLIVDSSTDNLANPMQRAQMLKLCPGAQEYHFKTGGHLTIVNCRDEYFAMLHRFLKG